MAGMTAQNAWRRLAFMLLGLVLVDLFVPTVLERLERRRYEGNHLFRFENSDLFGLGPAVAYLREHPHSNRHRAVFLGNSMTFGYLLEAEQTMPAQFEKRRTDTRVFNMAINSQELGTSYLVAKAIIDSVDVLFVQTVGESANATVASLIPVDDSDLNRFHIVRSGRLEERLKTALGCVWRLYRDNERIQAALFGTSTRLFVYTHRGAILHFWRPDTPAAVPAATERPSLRAPRAPASASVPAPPTLLDDFAELARAHQKRVILIQYEYSEPVNDAEVARFNARYAPAAEMVIVHVPQSLTVDGQHLNAAGSALVAEVLDQHEREMWP
jgi:hypothetical protein